MDPWETKPAEGEKTSVWKKDISFRRKPKPAAAAGEAPERKPSRKERREESRYAKEQAKAAEREAKSEAKFAAEQAKEREKLAKQQAKEEKKAAKAAGRGKRKPEKPAKEPKERKPSRRERRTEAKRAASERKRQEAERKRNEAERKSEDADAPRAARGAGLKRKKRLVGLKIGSSQLAAARVVNNGSADLVQVVREPLETGIVVGGEPRQPDELANALRDFFKKHKLPRTGVRLGIANNRIGVRTLEVTGIDDPKQLDNAIRFRAQEALPIPLEEAVLDYQVLSERVDAATGRTVRRVLLVVAYRDLIDRYVSACRKAGIRLSGIDLEAFGLLRALTVPRDPDESPRAATVVVNVGHDRSTFGVSDGLHCEFTRVLDWGGSKLGVAIARALDLAPSEAAPIKHALSLLEPVTPAGLTAEQGEKARDAAQRELHSFARELVSALQFYQNQPGSLGIGEVVLTGGTAELPGIDVELRRLIGVPVRVGDPLVNVRLGKKVNVPAEVGSLATAIGLGIDV